MRYDPSFALSCILGLLVLFVLFRAIRKPRCDLGWNSTRMRREYADLAAATSASALTFVSGV